MLILLIIVLCCSPVAAATMGTVVGGTEAALELALERF